MCYRQGRQNKCQRVQLTVCALRVTRAASFFLYHCNKINVFCIDYFSSCMFLDDLLLGSDFFFILNENR